MPRKSTAILVLLAALAALARPAFAELREVTSVEGITEYRLDNGLKVLLFPDESKPTVTVSLTVFVGSRHEGYGEAGMAHLLEHMLFKGTPDHPNVPKALKDRGAEYNGTTWYDRTNYFETLPAGAENLEFAIRLEADRLVNSYVRAEDLASEMSVVRSEFEQGENRPASVLRQRMIAAAYLWHNYGKATIGNRADIERVPIDRLKQFYKKYYQPDNAMLVIAGRFDAEQALEFVEKYFGKLPKPERALEATYTEEPPQDGERIVTLRRVGDVAVVGAVYHIPAGPHPDYPAVDVLEGVLTHQPAGRLYKALVETKKAASIMGSAYPLHDPGVLILMAEVAQGNAPEAVLDTMFDTIDAVLAQGVEAEEVQRIKQKLLKDRELDAADTGSLAIELSEWAAQGDWRLYFLYRDRLEQVTKEDVDRVAAAYLKQNNRTVGMFVPTQQPERIAIPGTPSLAEMIGDYQGRETIARGEAFDVSPQNIEQRLQRATIGGGIKAVLLPKKTRGQAVYVRLVLRYGNEQNLQGLAKAAELLPTLMLRGTRQLTRQQLQDRLDEHRAQLQATGIPGEAAFTIETKRDQLPPVLDLLRQVLREPALPENEFEILRQAHLSRQEQRLSDPQALATTWVRRRLFPYQKGDPRYVPTVAEETELLKALTLAEVRKLYEGYLSGSAGELAVVGDFDPGEILPLFSQILEGWKATAAYERLKVSGEVNLQAETETILTPDKANAVYFAATVFPVSDAHPDFAALEIGNDIFGGGSLSSRLGDRVRQQEGLSYGVGSGFNARPLDDRAALYVFAICNPINMEKVQAAIREELDKLLAAGVAQEELAAAVKGYLENKALERTEDAQLAAVLTNLAFAGRTMQYYADLEAKIASLTPQDVHAALRRHVDPRRIVVAVAGDFQKKPAGR